MIKGAVPLATAPFRLFVSMMFVWQIRQKLRRKGIRLGKKRIRQMMDAMGLISCEVLQTEYLPRQPEVPCIIE